MKVRAILLALAALFFAAPALAVEEITNFDVAIAVETDGDIVVTETIAVTAEGEQIRRGIFRDLPRFYETEAGVRYAYQYRVLDVERNGAAEPFNTDSEDNAFQIRIGDEDVFLDNGPHIYVIRYEVKNQVRYFDAYDEIYWNATGNYWAFPIAHARATITLPPGARITETHGYTGRLGETGNAYTYTREGDRHIFETTGALAPDEGLTVAIGFAKGLIDPPSPGDNRVLLWQRYGALGILTATILGLLWFLWRGFNSVGRDPPKAPVFARYEPPAGYSPAATHYIYNRAVVGHRALIATLMHLAVKGRLTIDAENSKRTLLTRGRSGPSSEIAPEDAELENLVFAGAQQKAFGGAPDTSFTTAYQTFQRDLARKYGSAYFRWNFGYTLLALLVSGAVLLFAVAGTIQWTSWHTLGLLALAAINVAYMYFMPAPTVKGQQVRTEIEGFKLYMEKAEKLQLNAFAPGSGQPPPMTTERYEKFLPYAVALGVEEPWTKYFQHILPEAAAAYNPQWSNMSGHSLGGLTNSIVSNMSSGVSSAMPQSSGSSGSGGGGSSGGGGGGGGGGGW